MTTIDIVIIILLGIGAVSGLSRGFFKELATIAGLVIGLIVARALYLSLAEEVAPFFNTSATVAQVISFLAIWLIIPLVFTLVAEVLTKAFKAISMGWLNHLAGIVVGILKFVIIVGLIIGVLDYLDTNNKLLSATKKEESLLYYPIKGVVMGLFFPRAKEIIEENKENLLVDCGSGLQ